MIAILAALLLAGCSGGDDESAGTTQTDATVITESSTATTESPETQEAADAFIVRVNEYIRYGQFRRAWLLLHPAQKKVVSASDLADCFGQSEWPPNAKLKVTEAYAEPWDIPGGPRNAPSTAVTIQVNVEDSEEGSDVTSVVDTFTQHAFPVSRRIHSIPGGLGELERWAWILAPRTFSGAKDGSC